MQKPLSILAWNKINVLKKKKKKLVNKFNVFFMCFNTLLIEKHFPAKHTRAAAWHGE